MIGVVAFAMVAFIGSDLLSGNSNIFSQPDTDVGEINGVKISIQEFERRLSEASNGQDVSGQQMDQMRNRVWNQLLQEKLVETEYAKIGISVTDEELWEEIKNNPNNAVLNQYFTNPQTNQVYDQLRDPATGGLNSQKVLFYIKQILGGETPENWYPVEDAIRQTILSNKYNNAIKRGLYVSNFDAEQSSVEENKRVSISYAGMSYDEITNDEVSYDDADLQSYYNAHKSDKEFSQNETTRGIKLISWNVTPTEADLERIKQMVGKMKPEFEAADNDTLFALQNSDSRNSFQRFKRYELPDDIDSLIFAAENGTVFGPYGANGTFKLTKKLGTVLVPDSVRARHILLQPSETEDTTVIRVRMDSLKEAIQNGADFAQLATDLSADLGSARNGGDLEWFTQGQMVPEFDRACFNGNVGDLPIVKTQYGYHLIEITNKTEEKEKIETVSIERIIEPSEETFEKQYNLASEFAIQNSTLDAFVKAAEENPAVEIQEFDYIRVQDKVLGNLESPRQLIRWSYDANIGEVSDVYEMGTQFIIAALSSVKEEGTLPFEEVKDKVTEKVIKEKKAELIRSKMGADAGVEEIAQAIGTGVKTSTDINFSSFSIPGIGPEAKILGMIFGLEEGQESEVVDGENGVYIVRVDKIMPADENTTLEITRDQVGRNLASRVDYEVFEALKEKGGVVDSRHKFY
tara:strand:+ start:16735 stop:18804 length:2070 start_codon:yes stop_codon:yes gene_type:complete